jgi:Uma2 family endonuclease
MKVAQRPDLKLKMQDWKSNGVALGWLIDPDTAVSADLSERQGRRSAD